MGTIDYIVDRLSRYDFRIMTIGPVRWGRRRVLLEITIGTKSVLYDSEFEKKENQSIEDQFRQSLDEWVTTCVQAS